MVPIRLTGGASLPYAGAAPPEPMVRLAAPLGAQRAPLAAPIVTGGTFGPAEVLVLVAAQLLGGAAAISHWPTPRLRPGGAAARAARIDE